MKREIEVKYLLKDSRAADELVGKLLATHPRFRKTKDSVVISYFYERPESSQIILEAVNDLLDSEKFEELQKLLNNDLELVVKARSVGSDVYFAVKGASKGEDAVHAVNRIEFEVKVSRSLEEVNEALTQSGIVLASKWYSERSFYKISDDIEVNIEFVSGYGYKAEIEIVIDDDDNRQAETEIRQIADSLGLEEASQELLGRMYKYYNQHWQEYFDNRSVFSEEVWAELAG